MNKIISMILPQDSLSSIIYSLPRHHKILYLADDFPIGVQIHEYWYPKMWILVDCEESETNQFEFSYFREFSMVDDGWIYIGKIGDYFLFSRFVNV